MRTRSQIIEALKQGLTSDNWKKLFNSLLGKELLAYGSEVIGQSEQIMDTFVQSLDYRTASLPALISLANFNDICISYNRPSYVRVKLSQGSANTIYKPFDLKFTSGSSTFTNLDYCKPTDEITLYQGVVKSMISAIGLTSNSFLGFRVDSLLRYKVDYLPQSDSLSIPFLNLGNALPESIFYIKRTNSSDAHALSIFSPLNYGPTVETYKLRTLADANIALLLGDGVWGLDVYPAGAAFQAVWLEPTNNEFTNEGTLTIGNASVPFTVVGSALGKNADLTYAQESFARANYKLAMISSSEQIREYCNSFSYVFDSASEVTGPNVVTVYIKPYDPNDIGTFGELESELDLHGSLFVKHSVTLGTPLVFKFLVSELSNLSRKSEVQALLMDQYGYLKLKYNDVVDAYDAAARIQSMLELNSFCSLFVTQPWSSYLLANPRISTIRLYDSSNNLIAYEQNGVLRGKNDTPITTVATTFKDFGIGKYNSVVNRGMTNTAPTANTYIDLYDLSTRYIRELTSVVIDVFNVPNAQASQNKCLKFVSTTKFVVVLFNADGYTHAATTNVKLRVLHQDMLWNYPVTDGLDAYSLLGGDNCVTWGGSTWATNKPIYEDDMLGNSYWTVQPCRFEYYNNELYYVHNVPHSQTTPIAPIVYTLQGGSTLSATLFFTSPQAGRQSGFWFYDENMYILQDSGYIDIIYNYSSANRIIAAKSVYKNNFASNWQKITVFKSQDNEFLIITIDSDNSIKVYTATGITDESMYIQFVGLQRVFNDGGIDSSYFTLQYSTGQNPTVEKSVSFIFMNQDRIVLSPFDSVNVWSAEVLYYMIFDRATGVSTLVQKSSMDFYESKTVGMVDYTNGTIIKDNTLLVHHLTYETQSISNLEPKYYSKLDETEPVIWK